jgi:transcription initiation factor TFIIH subunit 2
MASAPRTDEPDFDVLDMDVDDGDDNVLSSTWEQGYARPWEDLQLDDSGRLKSIDLTRQRNRKRDLPVGSSELVEKGVVRYLYIIMDCSEAMNDIDVRPSRRVAAVDAIQTFLAEFFQQNPISHVGLIVTHSGIAEKLTPLSGFVSWLLVGVEKGLVLTCF